jgi:hypothetical protein
MTRMMMLLLAVYLGDLEAHEPIIEGYARALGYAKAADLNRDIRYECAAAGERHATAAQGLFTSRGLNPAAMTDAQFGEVIGALVEGLEPSTLARAGSGESPHG